MTKRSIEKLYVVLICAAFIACSVVASAAQAVIDSVSASSPPEKNKPVQVFILMGQSNMLGFGKVAGDKDGTLEFAVKNKAKYPYLIDETGSWTQREDVRNVRVMVARGGGMAVHQNEWLTITGKNIGPEIGIGHQLGDVIDGPVMLLKSCIGNRSLGWDLLPPGSESYEFEETDKKSGESKRFIYAGYKQSPLKWEKGTEPEPIEWYAGKQYDDDVANAKQVLAELDKYYPGATEYEIAGFFWWQGDKDRYDAGHASRYEQNLVRLIEQLRADFDAPAAKFVCATLGQTKKGDTGNDGLILNAQLAVDGNAGRYPQFSGNVATVYTNPLSLGGASNGHYNGNAETYMNVGEAMGQAMVELLAYKETSLNQPDRKQQLETRFTDMLAALHSEITQHVPNISVAKREALRTARQTTEQARKDANFTQQAHNKVQEAKGLVDHAKGKWIGGAEKEIARAQAALNQATNEQERETARLEVEKWEANKQEGIKALEERQAAWERAKLDEPRLLDENRAAQATLADAEANELATVQSLLQNLKPFLSSDALDAKLAKFVVLHEATPARLAEFAAESETHLTQIERMLADDSLLLQMVVADGAQNGNYGRAMQIYHDIQRASDRASDGNLQRLALAIALEHATPIAQRNAASRTDAPEFVDPVKRYLHYEHAFLDGELDPAFKDFSVWDYRMVVYGDEPDEMLAWGREMLRNYRPDQITMPDQRWRYVSSVRTDIRYGSEDNKYDRDDLQFYQNILMNGGICGRRAFFGRFLLRAFGIPTAARPQPGHAALVRWTPDGWVPCLGAGWGSGSTKTPYGKDLNFLATTQARALGESFMQVKRAHWIGDVMGEPRTYGLIDSNPDFWNSVALYSQREMIAAAEALALAAIGEDIAEANESKEKEAIAAVALSDKDREIIVDSDGTITIPAAACSRPTKSTGKIIFMPSNLGGLQLHYSRNGQHEPFEYTFNAPAAGKYILTARVVTPSWRQSLFVTVNGSDQRTEISLPFTVGMWETTPPIEIELRAGPNHLRFTREGEVKGLTIRDFTLKSR
ncbi:MAG: hypothetical protein KF851_13885 [Pirellulaceae bacterium]|nr:hypothetical protein [Pirellulaceae bacterium]